MAAVMGWGASFVGLHAYGQDQMVGFTYWSAWLIPATFDGAAFGATLITYRASIYGRSAVRGRLLMWIFTGISSWINWIHQATPEARIVAAGLPVAAVAVFDVVLAELRADYEDRHGKRRLRLRPGLLVLRWLVDREGTSLAFRRQVTDIPVSEIAGLGILQEPLPASQPALQAGTEEDHLPVPVDPEREKVAQNVPVSAEPEAAEEKINDKPVPEPEIPVSAKAVEDVPEPGETPGERLPEREPEPVQAAVPDSEQTVTLPPVPSQPLSDSDKRTFARRDYRLSLEAGEPLTGAQLGQRYGFSERWGQRQIAAVRVEMEEEETEQRSDRHLVAVEA